MTHEIPASHDVALDVSDQTASPADPKGVVTRAGDSAPAHAAPGPISRCRATTRSGRPCSNGGGPDGYCIAHTRDPQALATLQAARSAGGRAPRVNVHVGLTPAVAEAIDLSSSAGQLAVATAAARALALGRISSTTATALATLVKAAAGVVQGDQEAAIRDLEAKVTQLADSRVIGR